MKQNVNFLASERQNRFAQTDVDEGDLGAGVGHGGLRVVGALEDGGDGFEAH